MTMNKKMIAAVFVAVAAAAAMGAYFFSQGKPGPVLPDYPASAEALFQTRLNDLEGKPQPLAQWRGKVMVVNFWATWCPPCRAEMPEFIKMQETYREKGLIFVGIALDQKDKVQAFADELGVNYPLLLGELDAVDLARKLGNRLGGLPYTVIVGRDGKIAATHMGGLDQAKLISIVKPLL